MGQHLAFACSPSTRRCRALQPLRVKNVDGRAQNVCMPGCSCGDLVAAAGSVFSGRGGDCHSEGEDETSNTEALLQVQICERCNVAGRVYSH